MIFDYQPSLRDKPQRLTAEKWAELTRSELVNKAVIDFQRGDAAAKKRLPAVMWQASFGGGTRSNKNAIPSGLYMLDLDHLEGNTAKIASEQIVPHIKECGICLIHTTPSGHGLRVVARMMQAQSAFKTISEFQVWLAEKIGFKAADVDAATHDMARMSFVPPENYVHYIDLSMFNDEPEYTIAAPLQSKSFKQATGRATESSSAHEQVKQSGTDAELSANTTSVQTHYMGIALSDIAKRLIENMFDREICEGNRNTSLYKLARVFRYVCDFNAQAMCAAMPHYGLSESEVLMICKYACDTFQRTNMPPELVAVLDELQAEKAADETESNKIDLAHNVSLSLADYQKSLPPLPPLFRDYVRICPQDFKAVQVVSMLPVVGTLCTGVRALYLDGVEQSPSFMTVVTAPQASGKSFARNMYTSLTQRIQVDDATNRSIEEAYRQELKRAKNSKEQPTDPRAVIRLLPPSVSVAKLLQRLDYAGTKHLLTFCEEIDTLTKSNRSGAWAQKSDIYRNAFDNAEYGQDYMSDASYSTVVRVFYNLLILGTPRAVGRFFNDVEDGLVSRVIFAEIPNQAGKRMPKFGHFSEAVEKRNDAYVAALMAMKNKFDLAYLNRALDSWLELRRQDFLRTQNMALEIFRRRAAVVGFRAGLVAQACYEAANDDTKHIQYRNRVKAFALWVANYTLTALLTRFGDKMDETQSEVRQSLAVNYVDVYSEMGDTFTTDDLRNAAKRYGVRTPAKLIIHRWKANDLIEKDKDLKNTFIKLKTNKK